ncbi:unnamed protein product [Musa acuminata subsp. burmannicoides]
MYDYEMCSSTDTSSLSREEELVSTHLRGKFMKLLSPRSREAATETLTGGSSFVGQREERNLLSSAAPEASRGWLHIPTEHSSPTSHHLRPRWCNSSIGSRRDNPESHLPPSTPWHRTKPESQPPPHRQRTLVEVTSDNWELSI